jgi:hypothetical protein
MKSLAIVPMVADTVAMEPDAPKPPSTFWQKLSSCMLHGILAGVILLNVGAGMRGALLAFGVFLAFSFIIADDIEHADRRTAEFRRQVRQTYDTMNRRMTVVVDTDTGERCVLRASDHNKPVTYEACH